MRWLLCCGVFRSIPFVVFLLLSSTAFAQTDTQNNAMDLVCLTDRPAIIVGETTRLQAVAATQDGTPRTQPVSFEWQVTEGAVRGSGSDVEWNLSRVGIASGELRKKVTATVKAVSAGQANSSCSVEVFIGKRPEGDKSSTVRGGLIAGRRYLLPTQTEDSGYGLYSYVLLSGKPQNEEEMARYLKTLEACVQVLNTLKDFDKHVRRSQLNATHIPVKELPKGNEDDPDFAKRVLSVYDFARAKVLLNKFATNYEGGPYLISVKSPLSQAPEPVQVHILQNFTGVVPELAARGVKNLEYLSAQQRTWTEQSMRTLQFKLRNLIAVAAEVTPEVAVSAKSMIQFIKLEE